MILGSGSAPGRREGGDVWPAFVLDVDDPLRPFATPATADSMLETSDDKGLKIEGRGRASGGGLVIDGIVETTFPNPDSMLETSDGKGSKMEGRGSGSGGTFVIDGILEATPITPDSTLETIDGKGFKVEGSRFCFVVDRDVGLANLDGVSVCPPSGLLSRWIPCEIGTRPFKIAVSEVGLRSALRLPPLDIVKLPGWVL